MERWGQRSLCKSPNVLVHLQTHNTQTDTSCAGRKSVHFPLHFVWFHISLVLLGQPPLDQDFLFVPASECEFQRQRGGRVFIFPSIHKFGSQIFPIPWETSSKGLSGRGSPSESGHTHTVKHRSHQEGRKEC